MEEKYTDKILKKQYKTYKKYYLKRLEAKKINKRIRLPGMPEDISENIVRFILLKINIETTWDKKGGDLFTINDLQKIECKCFTSNGPISFSPDKSKWSYLCFLDARKFTEDIFKLYIVKLEYDSYIFQNIYVNKTETMKDQILKKRRPRINWKCLYNQIPNEKCNLVYSGTFKNIFI